jgi:hypothetical protein
MSSGLNIITVPPPSQNVTVSVAGPWAVEEGSVITAAFLRGIHTRLPVTVTSHNQHGQKYPIAFPDIRQYDFIKILKKSNDFFKKAIDYCLITDVQ